MVRPCDPLGSPQVAPRRALEVELGGEGFHPRRALRRRGRHAALLLDGSGLGLIQVALQALSRGIRAQERTGPQMRCPHPCRGCKVEGPSGAWRKEQSASCPPIPGTSTCLGSRASRALPPSPPHPRAPPQCTKTHLIKLPRVFILRVQALILLLVVQHLQMQHGAAAARLSHPRAGAPVQAAVHTAARRHGAGPGTWHCLPPELARTGIRSRPIQTPPHLGLQLSDAGHELLGLRRRNVVQIQGTLPPANGAGKGSARSHPTPTRAGLRSMCQEYCTNVALAGYSREGTAPEPAHWRRAQALGVAGVRNIPAATALSP